MGRAGRWPLLLANNNFPLSDGAKRERATLKGPLPRIPHYQGRQYQCEHQRLLVASWHIHVGKLAGTKRMLPAIMQIRPATARMPKEWLCSSARIRPRPCSSRKRASRFILKQGQSILTKVLMRQKPLLLCRAGDAEDQSIEADEHKKPSDHGSDKSFWSGMFNRGSK